MYRIKILDVKFRGELGTIWIPCAHDGSLREQQRIHKNNTTRIRIVKSNAIRERSK